MEDSYSVHRRRKAATKKRDKTPDPTEKVDNEDEYSEDEEDTRRKMEKMVEDTERMQQDTKDIGEEKIEKLARKSDTKNSGVDDVKRKKENIEEQTKEKPSDIVERKEDTAVEDKERSDAVEEKKTHKMEKPPRMRKKNRESYGEDSSDLDNEKRSLRRNLSPDLSRDRTDRQRTPSKNRKEQDEEVRGKRGSSKHKYSESDEESGRSGRKSGSSRRRERSSSRHIYSSESDEGKTVSVNRYKKQVIPLRDDSLMDDLIKARKKYARKEYDIDFEDEDVDCKQVRRRTKHRVEAKGECDEEIIQEPNVEKKSWFSWFPFLKKSKKEKIDETNNDEPPKEKIKIIEKSEPKKASMWEFIKSMLFIISEFKEFMRQNPDEVRIILDLRNRCINGLLLGVIYCGVGGLIFRFTEGAFESFYKCGVKRVKRDFLDSLWNYSHSMKEDDWKSMARRKLMEFEEQIHAAHEAGVQTYSDQRSWTFLNAVVYCLTVVTTIGYGHISPSTTTGRAITIIYAIFGIPMFLIILADFGKLFTRGIKFLWAFVRRLYYTGSCRKVRRTVPVQEVMKGVQLVYDLATFRRPSQMNPEDLEEMQKQGGRSQTVLNLDGNTSQQPDTPGTPAMSTFDVDDEFNLPISVAIFILLGYIFVGATLFYMWEDWGFFESFYFVFISMSTIGFGDFVPNHPIYMMCSIVYLVFGLALTSMCINVVQVMLSDQFQHASQKIGATMGLQLAEDDSSVQAASPPDIEIAEIHSRENTKEEKLAPKAKPEEVDL